MQTQGEIRELLEEAGLRPLKMFGQNFLIDRNLMNKLLELAELTGGETVLEVGAATGSLTEELLEKAARVVAVEIDRGMFEVLRARLGARANLTLIRGDVLAGKHAVSPEVRSALGPRAHLVANLPYNIATPFVATCLVESWRAQRPTSDEAAGGPKATAFDRLTFTAQQEVAERLAAPPGSAGYGPVSIAVSLLGRLSFGPGVPATAFWPRPGVAGRMVRIDFEPAAAGRLADAAVLRQFTAAAFCHRRKQIGSILKLSDLSLPAGALAEAMKAAGIDHTSRPQNITPQQFLTCSNILAERA